MTDLRDCSERLARHAPRKEAIARAFDSARNYDSAALIQAIVAERLAVAIRARSLPATPRILEIGCGTGSLTTRLRTGFGESLIVATDIAPRMIQRCRARLLDDAALALAVMDGDQPCLAPGFDLIASSLAAQWFTDLPGSLTRLSALLAPGGLLAVTTLASGTFHEWREAHAAEGLQAATPSYPSLSKLRAMRFPGCATEASSEFLTEAHPDGRAFLRALREIGAQTPGVDHPLSPGALRRVLRRFDAAGARASYEVATILIRREA